MENTNEEAVDCGKSRAPSLMNRVKWQLARSQEEALRAERLIRLDYLLSQQPEVAEILDLLERVNV